MVQGKGMVLCSLTSSFKLVQSVLVSSTEQRLKVHKEQRLARRPTPQTLDSLQQPNFTSLLKVTLNLQRILTGLTFRKLIQANLVLRFGTFARAGVRQPTETGASSAGTLHWPSWRHTSSCSLRKARANTAIFSHDTLTDSSR